MAACEYCTGTHYLSDDAALGPCVCCTPEAMQRRDRTIEALATPPELTPVEQLDLMESTVTSVRDAFAELEKEKAKLESDLQDAADHAANIEQAVSVYLASAGHSSTPAAQGDIPPALWSLWLVVSGT